MKTWQTAAVIAVAVSAAGIGAAIAPVAHGQARVVRAQSPRALEVLSGGSRIGVSIRDVEQADGKDAKAASACSLFIGVTVVLQFVERMSLAGAPSACRRLKCRI